MKFDFEKLDQLRAEKGLKQYEMLDKAGVIARSGFHKASKMGKWNYEKIYRLAIVLDVNPNEFSSLEPNEIVPDFEEFKAKIADENKLNSQIDEIQADIKYNRKMMEIVLQKALDNG